MEAWHTLSIKHLEKLLETRTQEGLSSQEAQSRLAQRGANKLPEEKKRSIGMVFIEQFKSPLIVILFFASAILFLLQEFTDASIILGILFFNATIGTIQEGKAQHTLSALKRFIQTQSTVRRDKRDSIIPDTELVPGDIILISEGERVPADARIIESHGLRVQESTLTGESLPVDKEDAELRKKNAALSEQINMLFKGTTVVVGNAVALVVATGMQTQIGMLSAQIVSVESDIPLKKEMEQLSRTIMIITGLVCALIFFLGIFVGNSLLTMFETIVSLAVSIIPEGLPIVVTLVLAQGVWRMAKRNALVKKLQAVEALGQADYLAVDKTGTITKNELVTRTIFTNDSWYTVSGNGYEPEGSIFQKDKKNLATFSPALLLLNRIATLCANAHVAFSEEKKKWIVTGDPIEAAALVLSKKIGIHKEKLDDSYKRLAEIPFSTKTHYHATLHIHMEEQGKHFLAVSGSPEAVLSSCTSLYVKGKQIPLTEGKRKELHTAILATAEQGLRIICFAYTVRAAGKPILTHSHIANLTFAGFYGMEDSLRPEVPAAVAQARQAGIKVVMMTGDHTHTATAIAREAGIYREGDHIMTGSQLESLNSEQLREALATVSVFARMTPEHKLIIIKGYKSRGDIIAMTGDGVNDAPALVSADLGIAMGKIGTEVAREASDIVLLDDNISSIVAAIEEGRLIYRSMKRVIFFLFSTNAAEALIITLAILIGFPVPFTAAQILWLNVVTDSFLDVGLGMEPKERGLYLQKTKNHALLDWTMGKRMLIIMLPIILGTLFIFHATLPFGFLKASTMALTTLTFFQWFNALNARSSIYSIARLNPFSNLYLLAAFAIVILLQACALYLPSFQAILHTTPLEVSELLLCAGIASSILAVEEIRKFIMRFLESKKILSVNQLTS